MTQAGETAGGCPAPPESSRRQLLETSASISMFVGLGAGYGTLGWMAGRYLFTSPSDKAWLFVSAASAFAPGDSLEFESPTGVRVTVTRRTGGDVEREPITDDFSALSSVCPHLGCRVHWEPQNQRYFCPCHNGVFDPEGRATSGPPADAGQELPRYPLRVEHGLVFIEMPLNALGDTRKAFLTAVDVRSAARSPAPSRNA